MVVVVAAPAEVVVSTPEVVTYYINSDTSFSIVVAEIVVIRL